MKYLRVSVYKTIISHIIPKSDEGCLLSLKLISRPDGSGLQRQYSNMQKSASADVILWLSTSKYTLSSIMNVIDLSTQTLGIGLFHVKSLRKT